MEDGRAAGFLMWHRCSSAGREGKEGLTSSGVRKGGGERTLTRPLGHTQGISSCAELDQESEKKENHEAWAGREGDRGGPGTFYAMTQCVPRKLSTGQKESKNPFAI